MSESKTKGPWPSAPLLYATGRIDFSPMENIERTVVNNIQEQLRKLDFRKMSQQKYQKVRVLPDDIMTEHGTRWVFSNREETKSVLLTKESLSFCVADYDCFEQYVDEMLNVLNIADKELPFAETVIQQVSLKYVDLLKELDNVSALAMIRPTFFSSSWVPNAQLQRRQYITEWQREAAFARIILFALKPTMALPPQLVPAGIKIQDEKRTRDSYIVDTEYYEPELNADYSSTFIEQKMTQFHEWSREFFEAIVTPQALALWKGGEK
ncbi:MAG: TIGR04255 family protein [Planctomycetia bacterium]|nr:TIGR04255 family protein [Planctomycetia bacterium]